MEISLQDHFQKNELCKQNHNRDKQTIYIQCPGPCKKTYFKFGKSIEMHLKKSNCSEEVPLTFLPRLKTEFQEFKTKRRKKSKQNWYLKNKSKRQKTAPLPSTPPRDDHGKETEDATENSDESSEETENSVESSEGGRETEETENNDTTDDEICRGCSRVCKSPFPNPGYNSILAHLSKKGVDCKKFYTELEMQAFRDLAKKLKNLKNISYSLGRVRTEPTSFKTEKDRHASIQRRYLQKFDKIIQYQFHKAGFTKGNQGRKPSDIRTPFQASEVRLALKEKCLWKIDNDCSYASDEFGYLKKEGKKLYNIDFYILQDKHEVFFTKQNTLKNLLSKIQQTSDDPEELSKLEADVDEELKISDDLMFRTLHLRQKYISDECKKSNN